MDNCEGVIQDHDNTYLHHVGDNKDCYYYGKAVPTHNSWRHACYGRVRMSHATRAFPVPLYACEGHYSVLHFEKGDFEFEYEEIYNPNDNDKEK